MARLLLFAGAAIAVGAGCGGDDSSGDLRMSQIGGTAELAVYAYAAAGPSGLADYLARPLVEACSNEELEELLAGDPAPTGFRQLRDFRFEGDGRASVTVIFPTEEGDWESRWTFVREGAESWRIIEMPGLTEEECRD
jgi:hypothetical protein